MKHKPTLIGVAVLFAVVYFLTEASLDRVQLAGGIVVAVLVYGALMSWHIRNLLE